MAPAQGRACASVAVCLDSSEALRRDLGQGRGSEPEWAGAHPSREAWAGSTTNSGEPSGFDDTADLTVDRRLLGLDWISMTDH